MLVYQGIKFEVHLLEPKREREVIKCRDVVVIVPVLNDDHDELLMIQNWRPAIDENLLEFPAGRLDSDDEPLVEAAHRELREETGFTARNMLPMGSFYTSPGFLTERLHVFLAEGLTPHPDGQALSPTEVITIQRLSMEELWKKIEAREVMDAKTLAAIMLLAAHETKRDREQESLP